MSLKWVYTALREEGIDSFIWVPGSKLKELIDEIEQHDVCSIGATREEEAIGIAAGMHLAGRKPIVLIQSSGLASSLNAICELLVAYQIPVPFIISVRGMQNEANFVHTIFGQRLEAILQDLQIPYWYLVDEKDLSKALHSCYLTKKPVIVLIR